MFTVFRSRDRVLPFALLLTFVWAARIPAAFSTEPPTGPTPLSEAIQIALSTSLDLKSSEAAIQAAESAKQAQRTRFFPTFSANYQYDYDDQAQSVSPLLTAERDLFTLSASVTQPVFTGFVLQNQYRLAGLGVDISRVERQRIRQEVILRVKQAFFGVLRSGKLLDVARQTIQQIEVQRDVAENFYNVGMTPLNDLLQAQVELANAQLATTVAENNLEIARANFNTVLRRPVDSQVELEDVLSYTPFAHDLAYCQSQARQLRPEAEIAALNVAAARREVEVEKGGYYPTVNVRGSYYRLGEQWEVDGGQSIYDPSGWNIMALASWNFWEWGRTGHLVRQKMQVLDQAQLDQDDILDQIRLQVQSAYLRTKEAEENIVTSQKAIEQARENYRINQERYKEQVSTNTEVLIAQTLLTRTMVNHYNALYDFQLSQAALYTAMGQEVIE